MLKDFKEFAFKGNLIDMAVGIIIGGAFATVVKSLVDNVFMPPLGMITGGIDFTKMAIILKEGVPATEGVEEVPAIMLNYGQFIADSISFIILAIVVFIVIKKVMGAMKKEEVKEEEAPPEPTKEEVLLTEIRDLLAKN
ncbi:MAG: large-conductance mechanosensitive channel protein MscL [Luteolibacter sp.]